MTFSWVHLKMFGNRVTLLYTDTASLILEMETDDFYQFMKENIHRCDRSNHKMGKTVGTPVTKSMIGKMKEEFADDIIISFYSIDLKAYYILSLNDDMKKTKEEKYEHIQQYFAQCVYRNETVSRAFSSW